MIWLLATLGALLIVSMTWIKSKRSKPDLSNSEPAAPSVLGTLKMSWSPERHCAFAHQSLSQRLAETRQQINSIANSAHLLTEENYIPTPTSTGHSQPCTALVLLTQLLALYKQEGSIRHQLQKLDDNHRMIGRAREIDSFDSLLTDLVEYEVDKTPTEAMLRSEIADGHSNFEWSVKQYLQ